MDWKAQIEGCFGSADAKFARHPNDEDRAFALLSQLRNERVGWSIVRPAFLEHLKSEGCGRKHIANEMARVRDHFKDWLDD